MGNTFCLLQMVPCKTIELLQFWVECFLYEVGKNSTKSFSLPPALVQQASCKKFITKSEHRANLLPVIGYFGVQEKNEVVNCLLEFEIMCRFLGLVTLVVITGWYCRQPKQTIWEYRSDEDYVLEVVQHLLNTNLTQTSVFQGWIWERK